MHILVQNLVICLVTKMMLLWQLVRLFKVHQLDLSADGPIIRPPYEAYVQGGLTYVTR